MADFHIANWCPSAWRPWNSADGQTLRIRPKLGILSATQLAIIAKIAHGDIEISSRANIQLRGLNPENHEKTLKTLQEYQLVSQNSKIERLRNIIFDPIENINNGDFPWYFQNAIEDFLAQHFDLSAHLPDKFAWSVAAHAHSALDVPQRADVHLGPLGSPDDGRGWLVQPRTQPWALQAADARSATAAALALTHWVAQENIKKNQENTQKTTAPKPQRLAALKPAPFLPNLAGDRAARSALKIVPARAENSNNFKPLYPIGWRDDAGLFIAPAWARLSAAALARLAQGLGELPTRLWRTSALQNTPRVHVAPWRALLVPLRARPAATWIRTFLHERDWITHSDDWRLRASACPGLGACQQALGPTQALARAIAPHIHASFHAHISGCAKMCAKPDNWDYLLEAIPHPKFAFSLTRKNSEAVEFYSENTLKENSAAIFKPAD